MTFIILSCSDDSKDFKDNINIQAEENIKAKNEDIKDWVKLLRSDLEQRWNFIQAISEEYNGSYISNIKLPTDISDNNREFTVKFIITPSYQYYLPNRDQTISELEKELSKLKINVQVLHWLSGSEFTASGCNFEEITPNFSDGIIELFDKNCGNSYRLNLSSANETTTSNQVTSMLLNNNKVAFIFEVTMQNTSFASKNKFILEKVSN
jgi:hypothetical protein